MAVIKVFTEDGRLVDQCPVDDQYIPLGDGNMFTRNLIGRNEAPLGWLGRALEDAKKIQAGLPTERPSERVMRILSEQQKR